MDTRKFNHVVVKVSYNQRSKVLCTWSRTILCAVVLCFRLSTPRIVLCIRTLAADLTSSAGPPRSNRGRESMLATSVEHEMNIDTLSKTTALIVLNNGANRTLPGGG